MNISTSVQNYTRHFLRGVRKRRKPLGRQAPARLLYWSYIPLQILMSRRKSWRYSTLQATQPCNLQIVLLIIKYHLHQSATRIISISYLKRNRFIFNYLNKSTVVSRRSLPAKNLIEPRGVIIGVRALHRHRVQEFRIIIWSSTVQ